MQGCAFCSEMEKMEFRIMDGPTSHGSQRMVKDPGKRPGEESGAMGGLKTRRKHVSPFSDLTDSDMATFSHSAQRRRCERHGRGRERAMAGFGRAEGSRRQPAR